MVTPKPSLNLLRSLSNEHVLRALMRSGRATRAELSVLTGISKPTVADSVRRLTEAGLLVDTGERSTGRGRSGSYYALPTTAGTALVVSIAPEGIAVEIVDARGVTVARTSVPVVRPARPERVAETLVDAAATVAAQVRGPIRVAVVSAADPVDRVTGRTVDLPDAPFLLGNLSPRDVLAPLVDGRVVVDNDVNWAARHERASAPAGGLDDFVYLYLGQGLGLAVVSDGEVRRGHRGIAGEISHVLTVAPNGRAATLTDVLADLGLRQPGSTAIDVALVTGLTSTAGTPGAAALRQLAEAIAGVLAAAIAVADPELIAVGGPWGREPAILAAIAAALARHRRHVPVRAAIKDDEPALAGARRRAVDELQDVIVKQAGEAMSAPGT